MVDTASQKWIWRGENGFYQLCQVGKLDRPMDGLRMTASLNSVPAHRYPAEVNRTGFPRAAPVGA